MAMLFQKHLEQVVATLAGIKTQITFHIGLFHGSFVVGTIVILILLGFLGQGVVMVAFAMMDLLAQSSLLRHFDKLFYIYTYLMI